MPTNPRTPVQTILSCTNSNSSVTFAEAMGSVYIQNTGSIDVWVNLNGSAATSGDAVGQTRLLASGGSLNIDDTSVASVNGIANGAGPAVLQIVAHPRPGSSGAGMQ